MHAFIHSFIHNLLEKPQIGIFYHLYHSLGFFLGSDGDRNWVHVGRTRPMNQKWLSSVMLCTHHLRGLTGVEEGFTFWDEGFTFLHGLFPYLRNPFISTHESVRVRGLLRLLHMYKHSRLIVPVLPFSPSIEKGSLCRLEQIFLSPVLNCVFTPQDANPRTP